MNRETVQGSGDRGAMAGVRGAVIVAHGGTEVSSEPVTPLDPAVLRMIPLALAIRHGLRGSGIEVSRPRYRVRGWNGELASPVRDLREAIDEIVARFGPVPVVLIGHSMGARAAFRVAGHPAVSAVAGLAPWLPPTEPVDQLAENLHGDDQDGQQQREAPARGLAMPRTFRSRDDAHPGDAGFRQAPPSFAKARRAPPPPRR